MFGKGFGKGNDKGQGRSFGKNFRSGCMRQYFGFEESLGGSFNGIFRGQGRNFRKGPGLDRLLGFCRFSNFSNSSLTNEEKEYIKTRLEEELKFFRR